MWALDWTGGVAVWSGGLAGRRGPPEPPAPGASQAACNIRQPNAPPMLQESSFLSRSFCTNYSSCSLSLPCTAIPWQDPGWCSNTGRIWTGKITHHGVCQLRIQWWKVKLCKTYTTVHTHELVGSSLFCIRYLPCSVSFCGACLEAVWRFETRIFYVPPLRVKIVLACQEGPKMKLALNQPEKIALHSYSNTTSEHAPQVKGIVDFVRKTTNRKS